MSKEHKQVIKQFLIELVGGIAIVYAMLGLALLFGGCKTVERENIVNKTDTVRIYTQQRDSIIHRDSVFYHVYERGDTVYSVTERWNVRYNDRVRVDTVYKSRDKGEIVGRLLEEPWWEKALPWLLVGVLGTVTLLLVTRKKG